MTLRHFTHIRDLGPEGVERILSRAAAWKGSFPKHLVDRVLAMVFFNPSLRTRASFETVMIRGGGSAVVLEVGNGVWKLEDRLGAVMDGDRAEHVREAVPVLARYADALAVRTFATCADDAADHADPVIGAFRQYSTVPVISMESAREHPCQGLADLLTARELFGPTRGLPVTLAWAPHIKPLPKAVPNSFLLTAAAAGCEVRVAHPEGFELMPEVLAEARGYAQAAGGSVSVTHDLDSALAGSRVLYAKSWGPATAGGPGPEAVKAHPEWLTSTAHLARMAPDAIFEHCLPVRRNVEVSDAVLDSPQCRVVDEAENRFHVQRALLDLLIGNGS
ncbi:MAG: N-acetylornithine carbamoyltransferase [Acidobacteria bacterium]|nr:N-acetylornithine carbamoyltransferase [Acidobacteriota bacterium]